MSEFQHGGNIGRLARRAGFKDRQILDFSANINPMGPPECFRSVVSSSLGSVVHYPDPECLDLKMALQERCAADTEEIMVGNGSTELIYLLPRSLGKRRAVVPVPSYSDYVRSAEIAGIPVVTIYLRESDGFSLDFNALESSLRGDELVFLGHPNNPTGIPLDHESVLSLAARHLSTVFVIDEAFADLGDGMVSLVTDRPPNVIVIVSLTKTYAIPGLRLGCGVADKELVRKVEAIQLPWTVNRPAQMVGRAVLADTEYLKRSRELVRDQRSRLAGELASIEGLTVFPGRANFLLVRIDRKDLNAIGLAARLLSEGIAIRVCDNFDGLDERFFRLAVRSAEDNTRLMESLEQVLRPSKRPAKKSRKPAIMFQGVSSNAGKSVLAAGLCRVLLQDGYRVAPFKSQNMSLNSFVTGDGREMGRAQAVQAQACRLDPEVRMNPILLKPGSDTGSQVIVNGRPVKNMDWQGYVDFKATAFDAACKAFDELMQEYDVIVLEGAGSPGEVNLKQDDIANMQMARYARSPVLLVGDIDRGGVFASFVGTMEVLAEWERNLVGGFIVNRFRGDETILRDAFDYTERHTGLPVLGVVPFLADLGLPEEDSVTFKSGFFDDIRPEGDCIEIAVIDLPHISNFTDFDAFRVEPDVRVRIVRSPRDLNRPDAVILPGSKNVPADLTYLREKGFDRIISACAAASR
jgi:adenosylcobyric acid synthase